MTVYWEELNKILMGSTSSLSLASIADQEEDLPWTRFLNETGDGETAEDRCARLAASDDSSVLRNTMRLYGTIFLFILIAFCWLRRRFPQVYNVRKCVEEHRTELASSPRGAISWMWRLFSITDKEMMDECGMDALCYARVLEYGMKLSIVGILNGVWLIPVYATAERTGITECISDWVVSITVANVPRGSQRYVATVFAAYFVFGYAMYSILQEFAWFSRYRHKFLAKKLARNYCVYVQCIPEEYRSNEKLLEFFQEASSPNDVLEAHVSVKIPNLQKKFNDRATLVAKLEHNINLEDIRGVRRTAGVVPILGDGRTVVETQLEELENLNKDISETIERIERQSKAPPPVLESNGQGMAADSASTNLKNSLPKSYGTEEVRNTGETESNAEDSGRGSHANSVENVFGAATQLVTTGFKTSLQAAGTVANAAASLLSSMDGAPLSAGFVTFKSLRAAQAAKQMVQYAEPFAMEVLEAPQPEDIIWKNVGKEHKELQLGKLLSFGLTAALCLFWTIPMSFISTLSTIDGLRGEIEFIDRMLTDFAWLEPVFEQLAPLLIVVVNVLLKMVLAALSRLEGPISGAVIQASLFAKLATFMIIQTFFVTAIGGGFISQLSAIVEQPTQAFEILGKALPGRSTFFVQILLVDTFLTLGLELLRVPAVVVGNIRKYVGPRLTEKERETTWMGLRPFNDPSEFEHADVLASTVLYFLVFFVYAVIAPFTPIFMLICFGVMAVGYRHQFVYIYPTFPDSGGKLWTAFLKFVPMLMIVAQVTILGVLALNQAATASALMIPLLVITILFKIYIHQKHFLLTEFLPIREAIHVDKKRSIENEMDFEFVQDRYVQPELRVRELYPYNFTVEREIESGVVQYGTPASSENGDVDEHSSSTHGAALATKMP